MAAKAQKFGVMDGLLGVVSGRRKTKDNGSRKRITLIDTEISRNDTQVWLISHVNLRAGWKPLT